MNATLPTAIAAILLLYGCSGPKNQEPKKEKNRPNIILIMGDDIGYSDLGCYGSEIQTPNLDRLAENGIRFRTFYNSAKCNPTRSSLLTGLYKGDDRSINFATVLGQAGYTTITTGKEHFDNWVPESCYAKNAFEYSFTYPVINNYFIPPDSVLTYPYYQDGNELEIKDIIVVNPPFFKTDVVTDYALRYMDTAMQKEKPFFLYLAYNAAHYPLQAKPEDIEKYRGKYRKGWDVIRRERYNRMMEMGLLTEKYKLSDPTDNINKFRGHPGGDPEIREKIPLYRPWDSLTEKEKDDLDLEMAVFAAMIDCMDQNIGRVIQKLEENGELDNTLIMYLSDNGSCPFDSNRDFDIPPGPANSYRTLCAAWANVGNTPFKYFKQFGHEGGSNTHFIVHWPDLIEQKGIITPQVGHLIDIYPTLLEVTGAEYPGNINDRNTIPLHGASLIPIFKGEEREEPEFFISGFLDRFRMFRSGDWKIVIANEEDWELYNITEDPSETNNLANEMPEKLNEMLELYYQKSMEVNLK
ncbi:MAG: arylsulfatase [Bacteroidales bacterium]